MSTSLFESGELSGQDVWLVGRTAPFRNYLWATRKDLDEELRAGLLDAFLALDRDIAWSAPIITPFGATTFLPVSRGDYDELRRAAAQVGLLDSEGGD